MEIIISKTLFDLLVRLLTFIERLQNLIDETLDLMIPKTLKWLLQMKWNKNDSKWSVHVKID